MEIKERFEKFIFPIPECGCWIWEGKTVGQGYGGFWANNKTELAHRSSWKIYKGEIPKGMCVLHSCDTPSCVNPRHLFVGTHKENTQDCIKKKRWGIDGKILSFCRPKKLTAETVKKIRLDKRKRKVIAKEYNISLDHVTRIRSCRQWRWL